MEQAVGGDFAALGALEFCALRQFGLRDQDYVVDVGCGSGRLAKPLSLYLKGKYLGTDVVPELVAYAAKLVQRRDWRFEVVEGIAIPEGDGVADLVCFFSVLTHLLHEESYVYLREARRVLKPGGTMVFSFLEFAAPGHWPVFEKSIESIGSNAPLSVFIGRDAIAAWAEHLGLAVEAIHGADDKFIQLPEPITFANGTALRERGSLGQSVCVLSKRG